MPVATTALLLGRKQYIESRRMKKEAENLERERRLELEAEARARAAAAERSKTAGKRAGRGSQTFSSALGFGTAMAKPGLGRGSLFGN